MQGSALTGLAGVCAWEPARGLCLLRVVRARDGEMMDPTSVERGLITTFPSPFISLGLV